MYTSVYLKRIPGSPRSGDSLPPPVPWALLVPLFGSSTSWGKVCSWKCCYLLGYQHGTLRPEAQQFLWRRESQEGGDVCGRWRGQHGRWLLRDRWHRWHCEGLNLDPSPRTCALTLASHSSGSRILLPTCVQFPNGWGTPRHWPWLTPSARAWRDRVGPHHDRRCPSNDSRCIGEPSGPTRKCSLARVRMGSEHHRCPEKNYKQKHPAIC